MRVKFGKPKVPRMRAVVVNEQAVITDLVSFYVRSVRGRVRTGQGAEGALPTPKDGGIAYNRSGELGDSVQGSVGKRGGIVRPTGKRTDGKRNAEVAGILEAPPKDLRSVNGQRGTYKVFDTTPAEKEAATERARQRVNVELVESTGVRHRMKKE